MLGRSDTTKTGSGHGQVRSHGCPVAPPRLKPVGSRLSVKPPRRGAIFLYSLATWNSQKGHLATFTPTVHLRPSCSASVEVLSWLQRHGLQQMGHRLGGASRTQHHPEGWGFPSLLTSSPIGMQICTLRVLRHVPKSAAAPMCISCSGSNRVSDECAPSMRTCKCKRIGRIRVLV